MLETLRRAQVPQVHLDLGHVGIYRAIAAKLDLSVNTVAVHRANIMNALGLHKTAELVVYAIQNGLVSPP